MNMEHNISRPHMDEILRRYVEATCNGVFTTADVMLATAEYLGRIIVGMSDTPVAGMQAAQVASDHLVSTVKAGMTAKGYNMGGH
jgi:hypothetical protein